MHILGANGHAKVVIDALEKNDKEISGLWDDNISIKTLSDYVIKGTIADFSKLSRDDYIIAVGNNVIRKKIANTLKETYQRVIHPQSEIAYLVEILGGTVCMANSTINTGSYIGHHVIVNTNASIDHDCTIENFVHISPQVGLAGNVCVGEGTHIGIGAMVIQGIKIGKWATIGAGAVIIRDVPDYAVVVGNPGRIIKYNSIT